MMKWMHDKGVELRGGDVDEAPQAYRRLPEVLAAHAGTIRVLHTLRSARCCDGGTQDRRSLQGLVEGLAAMSPDVRKHVPPVECYMDPIVGIDLGTTNSLIGDDGRGLPDFARGC